MCIVRKIIVWLCLQQYSMSSNFIDQIANEWFETFLSLSSQNKTHDQFLPFYIMAKTGQWQRLEQVVEDQKMEQCRRRKTFQSTCQ